MAMAAIPYDQHVGVQSELPDPSKLAGLHEMLGTMINGLECSVARRVQHLQHRTWLCTFFGQGTDVNDIGYTDVQRYVAEQGPRGAGLKFETLRKRLITLRMGLNEAFRLGIRRQDTRWWPRMKSDTVPNKVWWTHAEYTTWRLSFGEPDRICVDVYFHTGMHTSDVRKWKLSDVDLVEKRWRRYNTKSRSEPEWLPMSDEFADILARHIKREHLVHADALICERLRYQPARGLTNFCERVGIPKHCTPNILRSSFCSRLFELGMNIQVIGLFMGHKSDPLTSGIIRKHYLRFNPSVYDTARAALNGHRTTS